MYVIGKDVNFKELQRKFDDEGYEPTPLRGQVTIEPDQYVFLLLMNPEDDPPAPPLDLSVLDQFQPNDIRILMLMTTNISAGELKRLERHKGIRHLSIGPLHTVSNDDLKPLKELTWIESFGVSGPGVKGANLPALKAIVERNGLERLDLANTELTQEDLRALQDHSSLEWLSLSQTNVNDDDLECLAGLEKLKELDLSITNISGEGLRHLSELRHLRKLDIALTQVTNESLASLASLASLTELDLSRTHISDEGLKHLEKLEDLERLDMDRTQIRGIGFKHLRDLDKLKKLIISAIDDEALPHIGNLASLEYLSIRRAQVTNEGLKYLSGMENLKFLEIYKTKVTAEAAQAFQRKNPSVEVYYDGNALFKQSDERTEQ
jgi:Leucine-rich repeat (LRR) protein